MAKKILNLVFPQNLIKKPVIFTVSKKYSIIPNIRRARVTETIGEVTLEFTGKKENLEKAIKYLKRKGVEVEEVPGDVIE
jgi:ABC-type methionine transport system ATPase subunit